MKFVQEKNISGGSNPSLSVVGYKEEQIHIKSKKFIENGQRVEDLYRDLGIRLGSLYKIL